MDKLKKAMEELENTEKELSVLIDKHNSLNIDFEELVELYADKLVKENEWKTYDMALDEAKAHFPKQRQSVRDIGNDIQKQEFKMYNAGRKYTFELEVVRRDTAMINKNN
jgi:hypothetical protein